MTPYIIPFFIAFQGCPFQCLYCDQPGITATVPQLPSPLEIAAKIEAYLATKKLNKYSHVEVAFYGGTFTGLEDAQIEELLTSVAPFLKSGQVKNIRASTKPDYIFADKLAYYKTLGLSTIELGVQSLDDTVLSKVGRGYKCADVKHAVNVLKTLDYKIGIQMMPALPGADYNEAIQSTQKAIELKPDFVRVYPTIVLKNTALAKWYQQGRYQALALTDAVLWCVAITRLYQQNNIPIIKMGLEFSSDEQTGILAGPYHPRFRELVNEAMQQETVEHV